MPLVNPPFKRAGTALPYLETPDRSAPWLHTTYSSPVWSISDSNGGGDTIELSFLIRMPDGKELPAWPHFYAAVKEFAFWVRDRRFADIDDAETHAGLVRSLMHICYALALEGFSSFKHVTADVIALYIPRISQGLDSLLRASARLEAWLASRPMQDEPGWVRGLPITRSGHVDSSAVMAQVGLPDSAASLVGVSRLIALASLQAGLRLRGHTSAAPAPAKTLSVNALARYLHALELLYKMRRRIEADVLPERPFNAPAAKIAAQFGTPTGMTSVPPPEQALHLIAQSMVWVANYSGPLLKFWSAALNRTEEGFASRYERERSFKASLAMTPSIGPAGSPWPLAEKSSRKDAERLDAPAAMRHLLVACFVIIAAFSARRRDEILELRSEDLRGDDANGWELHSFIQKTLQTKDWIPIPPIAARAVRVLIALQASVQGSPDHATLFNWMNPFGAEAKTHKGGAGRSDAIDEFARWVRVPEWIDDSGQKLEWHWTWHQFRKFFAVLYFHRYRGATIEVLAQFLRHFNLEMTRRYVTLRQEGRRDFDAVQSVYTKMVARSIATSLGTIPGGMSKRLAKQWIDHMRTNLRVSSASVEAASSFIGRQMKRLKLVVTPRPWADCTCPASVEAARSAKCRSGTAFEDATIGPDLSRANPDTCSQCPFSMDNGHLMENLALEQLGAERNCAMELSRGTILEGMAQAKVVRIHAYRQVQTQTEQTL